MSPGNTPEKRWLKFIVPSSQKPPFDLAAERPLDPSVGICLTEPLGRHCHLHFRGLQSDAWLEPRSHPLHRTETAYGILPPTVLIESTCFSRPLCTHS